MAKILVTDDLPSCCEIIKNALSGYEHDIVYEPRKDKVLEILNSVLPHLVTTDLTPAPIGGVELVAAIKKYNPKLPVIVISGQMTKKIEKQAREAGAYWCTTKPFDVVEFQGAVNRATKR